MTAAALLALLAAGREDRVGGGIFEEGSTEKSLATNARLLEQMAEAGLREAEPELLNAAVRTGDYLVRDMQSPSGPFWLGEGEDPGDFYRWTCEEAQQVLGLFSCSALGLSTHAALPRGGDAEQLNALYLARLDRLPPATDTRIDPAANAVAVSSLARAGSLLAQEHWLEAAERAATALELRGEAALDLHQATGRLHWLEAGGGPPKTGTIALIVAGEKAPERDFFREAVLNQASDELFLLTLTPQELNDLEGFAISSPKTAQICREGLCEAGTEGLQLWIETLEALR